MAKEKAENKNLVSIADYAQMCGGLDRQAIYYRIKKKLVTTQEVERDGETVLVIDIFENPPKKLRRGRKPFKA